MRRQRFQPGCGGFIGSWSGGGVRGSGVPFHRLEQLEKNLGIPLPAATQWEIAKGAADAARPAHEELIRQAAQGEVLHNDDTSMRVLHLARAPDDERTGVFTSGVVSIAGGRRIALFFTGRQHAGENIAAVLKRRSAELPAPVHMCDGSSSNTSAYPEGVKFLLANCLAHRQPAKPPVGGWQRTSLG